LGAIVAHIIAPKAFTIALIYIYFLSMILQMIGYLVKKRFILIGVSVLQFILVFILFIAIMADDWCRFFLYRGNT